MNKLYPTLNTGDAAAETRKAALLLHALPHNDRGWLLDQLPPEERDALRVLLAELTELGIPADRPLLNEVIADMSAVRTADAGIATEPSNLPIRDLLRVEPAAMQKLLQDEPPMLIAQVLMIHDWDWSSAVLDHLGTLKRRQVEGGIIQLQQRKAAYLTATGEQQVFSELHRQLLIGLKAGLSARYPEWPLVRPTDPPARAAAKVAPRGWPRWLGSSLAGMRSRGNP